MPFTINDPLLYKRSERQRREIHEREYNNYLLKLREQSTSTSNMSYLSAEHLRNLERSRSQRALNRFNQYKQIHQANEILAHRIASERDRPIFNDHNDKYQQTLQLFERKLRQQRLTDYRRIDQANQLLVQRLQHVRGALKSKEEYEEDWQRHIHFMKKTSTYPENIDRFVSLHSDRE